VRNLQPAARTLVNSGRFRRVHRWHGACPLVSGGRALTSYEPRAPAHGTLYGIVRDHVETFRAQAASLRDGEGLPRFVEQEFRDFLRCGWLAGGLRGSTAATAISTG
jgi:hypothetical protein